MLLKKVRPFFKKANKSQHVPLMLLLDRFNGRTRLRKVGLVGVLMDEENKTIVAWVLGMQDCGLSITLQQLKIKVAKLIQTRPTPFNDGLPKNNCQYQFKHEHLECITLLRKRLENCMAQGLKSQSCYSFYNNIQTLYTQHKYSVNHIWNLNKISIQVRWQFGPRILAKRGSNKVYSNIPNFKEWLIVHYAMNAIRASLLIFYIFKGERIRKNQIGRCKLGTCMEMQTKAQKISYLFK